MLEFIGYGLFLVIGMVVGAGIMYAFELIMDYKEDKADGKNRLER